MTRRITAAGLCLLLLGLAGCHYYEAFRMMKGTADIRSETADLIRAYRECMEKYEKDPVRARDICGSYAQTLREIQPGGAMNTTGLEKYDK